ncbi:hypothetical protein E1B28_005897 [Marasmius oreades]|uniref:GTP-binding protein 2 n=1 Tax=Marasmius oreades TaxID=181124 RepID=A0A9P7S4E3_9AGAR|nr:uncharacterized protein E1B28_005897 [Marasmius oreades]KAG7095112.1 hypothetical protein E1B28_005897 [Marasmius oreades]
MFGEDDSESPRVPSPWDSLMSTPASSSPHTYPVLTSSPLAVSTIPKLVPEADDGNVEYKLQLLSPSPARFARLVTQLKWRLLEGGGQAYYELGVADSGSLVGLSRVDLECSLETLEMMAGEIGASVIVVKEIEVPAAMAEYAAAQEDYRQGRRERGLGSDDGNTTAAETENELSTTDVDTDDAHKTDSKAFENDFLSVFTMDPELDPADQENIEHEANLPQFYIDLEISSVFKPRPVRTRMTDAHLTFSADNKRGHRGQKPKKVRHHGSNHSSSMDGPHHHGGDTHGEQRHHGKSHSRRAARDRRREEKRKTLLAVASNSLAVASAQPSNQDTSLAEGLLSGLEDLHVTHEEPAVALTSPVIATDESIPVVSLTAPLDPTDKMSLEAEDDDVFASPTPSAQYKAFQSTVQTVTPLTEGTEGLFSGAPVVGKGDGGTHLIVEALVVRKMSLEEAFLDFGGFSLT